MKTITILVLLVVTSLPLLGLAGKSFVELMNIKEPPQRDFDTKTMQAAAGEMLERHPKKTEFMKAVVEGLEQADLFAAAPLASKTWPDPPADETYGSIRKDFETVARTHDGAVKFAQLYASSSSPQDEFDGLDEFAIPREPTGSDGASDPNRESPFHELIGEPEFRLLVHQRRRTLEELKGCLKIVEGAQELFATAYAARHRSKQNDAFGQCLAELAKIDKVSPKGMPTETLARIKDLQRQAAFWKHWSLVISDTLPKTADLRKSQLTELQNLQQLNGFGPPPTAVTKDERQHLERLDAFVARLTLWNQVDGFVVQPPSDAAQYLGTAASHLAKAQNDTDDVRQTLATNFREWIGTRLNDSLKSKVLAEYERKPENQQEKQGTQEKTHRILIGLFEGLGNFSYWYRIKLGADKTQVYLTGPPSMPDHIRWLEEYEVERKKLLEAVDSRAQWAKFHAECVRWNGEIDRNKNYPLVVEFAFSKEAELAKNVTAKWDVVESLLKK